MSIEQSDIQAYVKQVAKELGEKDEKPLEQIYRIVAHMGRDWVQEQVTATNEIEKKGGMKTDDGKRQRTKGGIFFYIVKGKLDDEVRSEVFPQLANRGKVVTWDERHDYVDTLMDADQHGNMRYVNITLHGRPGKVLEEGNSIITTIKHTHLPTPLPKGVPHPPKNATIYTVYMSRRQWRAVEIIIRENKNDRLIVEGTVFLDPDAETISVHAQQVSTRLIEKEKAAEETEAAPPVEAAPATASSKLEKLYAAAETFRVRIAEMEAKGQKGVNMTRQLLRNTEKQIAVLERAQPE